MIAFRSISGTSSEILISAGKPEKCGVEEDEYGLCNKHYKEYLVVTINTAKVEVIPMLPVSAALLQLVIND